MAYENHGLYRKSKKYIEFIKDEVSKGIPKREIAVDFVKKFNCHLSTFYDWWDYAVQGRMSGRRLNNDYKQKQDIKERRYYWQEKNCYFCKTEKNLNEAHLIYPPQELIAVMCKGCHIKYDSIQSAIKHRLELKQSTGLL